MDGGLTEPGDSSSEQRKTLKLSERFDEQFPYYLAMGMTGADYWDGDSTLVIAYRKAERIRREQENTFAWLQGMYIYEAVGCLSPILQAFAKAGTKARPYAEKPYEIYKKKAEKKPKDNKGLKYFTAYAEAFNIQFEKKKALERALKGGEQSNANDSN